MADLTTIRDAITSLDQDLLKILAKRRELSIEVAKSKIETSTAIRDQGREQALLVRLITAGRDLGLSAHYVTQLYQTIIEDSVLSQQAFIQQLTNPDQQRSKVKVAFLGNKGSYSNIATHRYFSRYQRDVIEIGCTGFQAIVDTVEAGQADYAMLPIESTSSGSVNDVFDVIQHTSLSIVGELTLHIDHGILTKQPVEMRDIDLIYAHPQPYQQCSRFLREYPHLKFEFVNSSSKAMETVANSDNQRVAAIGSQVGGKMYGLQSIQSEIANQQQSYTRFIIAARKPVEVAEQIPARTTFIMSTEQKPGSLVEALLILRDRGINMRKLESRPVQGNPWEEMFYVDVSANVKSEAMQNALTELTKSTRYIKVLGCYPSEEVDPTQVPLSTLANETAESSQEKPSVILTSQTAPLSSLQHKAQRTTIRIGRATIGDGGFTTFAGPDTIEDERQLTLSARQVKETGASILHAACFKPRSNPYGFQGLGLEGLAMLKRTSRQLKLPIMTEVLSYDEIAAVAAQVDIIQVGARNMQNFQMLKAVGETMRPILLERGSMASIDEWLNAANYIMSQGNQQVILCERGIRTFDTHTLSTLDLSVIPLLRERTHLPVIINPSDAVTHAQDVAPLARAAKALGADGVMITIHPEPSKAKVEAEKTLDFPQYQSLMRSLYQS
jgi:chorismate mutase/prephenate dehydratase